MKRGMPSGAQTPDGIIFLLALIFSKAPPRYPPHHGAHWAYTAEILIRRETFRLGRPVQAEVIIVPRNERNRLVLADLAFHKELPADVGVRNGVRVPAANSQAVWMSEFKHGQMQPDQSGQNERTGGSGAGQFDIDRLRVKFRRSMMFHCKISLSVIFEETR